MKYLTLIYLTIVFHLPAWRRLRHSTLRELPTWMRIAIKVRNDYERKYVGEGFYWFKMGRFYIRKNYSMPMRDVFACSRKHLFVWRKTQPAPEEGE